MKKLLILSFSCGLFWASCSDSKGPVKEPVTDAQKKFQATGDSIDSLANVTKEKYRAMTDPELIADLEKAALKGREPFNAPAFREIITRKNTATALYNSITDTTQKEFFKLMALKRLNGDLFMQINRRKGAAILTDALARSTTFNAWGIPQVYWESSAKAIIEYGDTAVPYLVPLLDDRRPAPVWGSEEAMLYDQYQYRVCDYAFALLLDIRKDKQITLARSPQERDKQIESYK